VEDSIGFFPGVGIFCKILKTIQSTGYHGLYFHLDYILEYLCMDYGGGRPTSRLRLKRAGFNFILHIEESV